MTITGRREQDARSLTTGTLVAAALGVCVAQVGLAIPAVLNGLFQQDLHTTSSQLTWISDAFLVPITLLELTFGVLGDLFGRKRLVIIGGTLLGAGELFGVLTQAACTVPVRCCGRAGVAGIGAAALFPTTLALVAAGTTTPRERARGISIWAGALATRRLPVPGARRHHRQDPLGKRCQRRLALVVPGGAGPGRVERGRLGPVRPGLPAPEGRSLDFGGQATIAVSLFALLFAVIQGPTSGWSSPLVIGGFIVAVIAFAAFIAAERRSPAPLVRLELFKSRSFGIAAIVTVLGMFAYLGTAYATSIRLSAIQGFSPLKTSIAFVLINGVTLSRFL